MTDRERYLILLSGLLRGRHALRFGGENATEQELAARHVGALEELHTHVEMVKSGTTRDAFLRDCSEAEATVAAHGGG